MNRHLTRGLIQIHFAVLLFGLAGLFGKWLDLAPEIIVCFRAAWAAASILVVRVIMRRKIFITNRKQLFHLLWPGIILAFHWTAFFASIQLSTVAIGLLTFSSFPIFVIFLAPLMVGEKIKLTDLGLAVLTLIGIYIILPNFDLQDQYTQGALWGIAAGASFAVLSLANKKLVFKFDGPLIAMYQNIVAAIVLLFFLPEIGRNITNNEYLLLALLGIVFTAASHSLFIQGMKHVSAQAASIIANLEPVYGIIAGAILLGALPSTRELLGGIIILSATLTISWLAARKTPETTISS